MWRESKNKLCMKESPPLFAFQPGVKLLDWNLSGENICLTVAVSGPAQNSTSRRIGPVQNPSICSVGLVHNTIHIIGAYKEEPRSGHLVQYLNNMSHGQNLSSTSGEPEFLAQKFFKNSSLWTSTEKLPIGDSNWIKIMPKLCLKDA